MRVGRLGVLVAAMAGLTPLPAHSQLLGNSVSTDPCSSGIGGNVTNSKISVVCGIPSEKVEEIVRLRTRSLEELNTSQKETLALLRTMLELSQGQIRSALAIVGERNIPPERLESKLIEVAQRLRVLQTIPPALPGDTPEIIALKGQADAAAGDGEFDQADRMLAEVEAKQAQAQDTLAANWAATIARRGELAMARLRYADAAKHFEAAADAIPAGDTYSDRRGEYLAQEAAALFQQGDEYGDNQALVFAIDRYQHLLDLNPRAYGPYYWAGFQINLGNSLQTLGERELDPARLEQAITAYQAALGEFRRERVPLLWATIQNNLGAVLVTVGERESDPARIEEAITAFRAALEEWTRDRVPLDWAMVQNNLGGALAYLGRSESDPARLEEAITAYRAVLEEYTRDRVPLDWAMVQSNLGAALADLGERESDPARLEEAITAFRAALEEQTRERVPLLWATIQNNLGATLEILGERELDPVRLEQAITAYQAALEERTRERVPIKWAETRGSLIGATAKLERLRTP